jgi:hypothetical protein
MYGSNEENNRVKQKSGENIYVEGQETVCGEKRKNKNVKQKGKRNCQ